MNPKILQNTRVISKCFVVREDGKILALKRIETDKSRAGKWDLPGGGYEHGEDITESIKREVKEEAGLDAYNIRPFYIANMIGQKIGLFSGVDTVFVVCYICTKWEGEVQISEEHAMYKWVTPQEFMTYDFGEDGGFFAASAKELVALPHPI